MRSIWFRAARWAASAMVATLVLTTGADASVLIGYGKDKNDPFGGKNGGVLTNHGVNLLDNYKGLKFSAPALAKCDVSNQRSPGCTWSTGTIGEYRKAFAVANWGFNSSREARGGEWSLDPAKVVLKTGQILNYPGYLVVKSGNTPKGSWAVYLLSSSLAGKFSTADLLNKGVSHVSWYNSAAPIPLPAAAWLMLGGLAGLAAVAHRRQTG